MSLVSAIHTKFCFLYWLFYSVTLTNDDRTGCWQIHPLSAESIR